MHNLTLIDSLILVIFALIAIIPSGIVFISIRSRQYAQDARINASFTGKELVDTCVKAVNENEIKLNKLDCRVLELEELLRTFVNRENTRERRDRKREEREDKEREDQNLPETEIPFVQQEIFPQTQPEKAASRIILRKKMA